MLSSCLAVEGRKWCLYTFPPQFWMKTASSPSDEQREAQQHEADGQRGRRKRERGEELGDFSISPCTPAGCSSNGGGGLSLRDRDGLSSNRKRKHYLHSSSGPD
ncbi:hypothetical protein AAFF_G00032640 [Aldrovandia affinis]|uniref:Uncharacterized protein n=1 Tax=Aldrovandia affinis TaxID=143900 RepID=A0AAD7S3W0_9TELE|nr:hypothetical protein AAFF_G00032640 [Aldrovandia affinis]